MRRLRALLAVALWALVYTVLTPLGVLRHAAGAIASRYLVLRAVVHMRLVIARARAGLL